MTTKIHLGEHIQSIIIEERISVTAFSKKICRTRNVVYDIFKREDMDTNLLDIIGKALGVNLFALRCDCGHNEMDQSFEIYELKEKLKKQDELILKLKSILYAS